MSFNMRLAKLILSLGLVALPAAAKTKAQAPAKAAKPAMVSFSTFKAWPTAKKKKYLKDLTRVYSAFEQASNKGVQFAAIEKPSFWSEFSSYAYAQYITYKYCLVGGVKRDFNAQNKCLTTGRGGECTQFPDGYKCGSIYNSVCISRTPTSDLTARCEAAAGPDMSRERYEAKKADLEMIAAACLDINMDPRFKENCDKFIARLTRIKNSYPAQGTQVLETTTGEDGVPSIESLGGNDDPMAGSLPGAHGVGESPPESAPEGLPEGPAPVPVDTDDPPDEVIAPTPRPRSERPADRPRGDCIAENKTQLGELACIACGMKDANPADTAGGVTNWVTLIGAMAQKYHGGFNVNDQTSKENFQIRVAEMVATYSYCTDNEFPIELPTNSRDWIDGRAPLESNSQKSQFANTFGLVNDRLSMGFVPFKYVKDMFDVGRMWQAHTPQYNQYQFRSKLQAQRNSFPNAKFTPCSVAIEQRMRNLSGNRMCPMENEQWRQEGGRFKSDEFNANEAYFKKLTSTCGIRVQRRPPPGTCDRECVRSEFPKSAGLPGCSSTPEPPTGCTSNCNPEPPCTSNCGPKGDETPPGTRPDLPSDPGKTDETPPSTRTDTPSEPTPTDDTKPSETPASTR